MKRETINHTRRRIPRLCFSISMQMACKRSINRDCAVLITIAMHTPTRYAWWKSKSLYWPQSERYGSKGEILASFSFRLDSWWFIDAGHCREGDRCYEDRNRRTNCLFQHLIWSIKIRYRETIVLFSKKLKQKLYFFSEESIQKFENYFKFKIPQCWQKIRTILFS